MRDTANVKIPLFWQFWLLFGSKTQRHQRHAQSLLRSFVVITQDNLYAEKLRQSGLRVVLGQANDEKILLDSGIKRARSFIVTSTNDTDTLLIVLTAHTLCPTLNITATITDTQLSKKLLQVGANTVITPSEIAGSFLNNATFRPAVNDFYSHLALDNTRYHTLAELRVGESSSWVGQSITDLNLDHIYQTSVLAIRRTDGTFDYAPDKSHVIEADEVLLTVSPRRQQPILEKLGLGTQPVERIFWQSLPTAHIPPKSEKSYSLIESEQIVQSLNKHYIVCASGLIARRAVDHLNPDRPFVIISSDNMLTSELLKRGFKVIHGHPTQEEVLIRAGIKRAQAIMITSEDQPQAILSILTARSMNKQLLITATAYTDDMIAKLERVGADRVVSPFRVSAIFTLLATTCPNISDFVRHVMFNYHAQLETTELYMEDDSPWIGQRVGELALKARFQVGVIGVRLSDRQTFLYTPLDNHILQPHEVLIVITPMQHSDALRELAHGNSTKRPTTLRTRVIQSSKWTQEEILELLRNQN